MSFSTTVMEPLRHPHGPLQGLPVKASEADMHGYLVTKIKKNKLDAVQRREIIDELVHRTNLGKNEVNAIYKRAHREATRPSDSGNYYPDVTQDDFEELVFYAQKRLMMESEKKPTVFQFADGLARIGVDADGTAYVEVLTLAKFEHELNLVSKWKRVYFSGDTEIERLVPAPKDVVQHLFNGRYTDFPSLRRLVTLPTFTSSLALCHPGYSKGIYYHPRPGLNFGAMPKSPSAEQVEAVVMMFADLFADIPLDGMSREELLACLENGKATPSFAHLISYALSSIARELYPGPTPGHLFRKDQPRSGATLAASAMEHIATCKPCAPLSLPTREEEIQKTLLSAFMAGLPYILFDNIKGGSELESDALAAAMTAYPQYQGRQLNTNNVAKVPATSVFGFTGNRSALSPQLAERLLLIDIDPKMENPGTRPPEAFKYELHREVENRREELYSGLLILVQNWIAKGCPEWTGTPLGGFGRHAAVVGGILEAAGVKGFMGNRDKLNSLVKTDDPITGLMDAMIAEHQATGSEYEGTLFKVGKANIDLPEKLEKYKGHRVVSFGEMLSSAQLPINGFGYKQHADGEVVYPPSADNVIAQRLSGLVGTVREGEGETAGKWVLQALPDVPRNIGKLYRLDYSPEEPTEVPPEPPKRRTGRGRGHF